jgi:hypothetical protein
VDALAGAHAQRLLDAGELLGEPCPDPGGVDDDPRGEVVALARGGVEDARPYDAVADDAGDAPATP